MAENSGGAHCFKYGFTTNYVTGLELVLPDGELVQVGGKELDRPGYDLLGAFVGSEGTLGRGDEDLAAGDPDAGDACARSSPSSSTPATRGRPCRTIVSAGIVPGAMEIMDRLAIEAAEGATHAGYPTDAGAALVVELDGAEAECEARFDEVVARLRAGTGPPAIRVAQDEAERELIWRARKAAFAAMGRIAPNYYVQDGVIPRTRLPEVLRPDRRARRRVRAQGRQRLSRRRREPAPARLYDGAKEGEPERAEELAGLIVKACVDAGGSITGEHGVGVDKKRYMPSMFSEHDLATFQRLRCAFDPDGLANPGKVMPTPRLCGEVPGPYRQHPLEAAGDRGALLNGRPRP